MPAVQILGAPNQLANLRRMKLVALSFLIGAGIIYVIARKMEVTNPDSAWSYVRVAAEAGVVGGLADWFAVTALFRKPLGLPIPHTALIPNKKDQLGDSLSNFVHGNFLTPDNVRSKVIAAEPAQLLGQYLSDPAHRRALVGMGAELGVEVIGGLNEQEIQVFVRNLVFSQLQNHAWAPIGGRGLGAAVDNGQHQGVVEGILTALHRWLLENQDRVAFVIADRGPVSQAGPVRWLHERVGDKGAEMVTNWVAELRDNPQDPARVQLDAWLRKMSEELQHDPVLIAQVENWKGDVLRHPETSRLVAAIWPTISEVVLRALKDPDSDLRERAEGYLAELALRCRDDREFAAGIDDKSARAAAWLVQRYGQDAVALISETVQRWDASEASRRIEIAVGKDLQFIRINGTVVGSLAGLAIYSVTALFI